MIKRIVWLLIPALIAAGLFILNRETSDERVIITGDSGALIYAASFDGDAALDGEWEQYEGRQSASITDGALRISVGLAQDGNYSLSDYSFRNFDVRVSARAVAGPLDNGYGVIFRLLDRDNYFLFMVSSDGFYSVQRILDGQLREISTWIPTTNSVPELNGLTVNAGLEAVNDMRVIARGDTFEFYVNGVQAALCIPNDPTALSTYYEFFATPQERCTDGSIVYTLTDDSIPFGQVGVAAQSFNLPATERAVIVDFEDIVVYYP